MGSLRVCETCDEVEEVEVVSMPCIECGAPIDVKFAQNGGYLHGEYVIVADWAAHSACYDRLWVNYIKEVN